jgi:hypothetical protein
MICARPNTTAMEKPAMDAPVVQPPTLRRAAGSQSSAAPRADLASSSDGESSGDEAQPRPKEGAAPPLQDAHTPVKDEVRACM